MFTLTKKDIDLVVALTIINVPQLSFLMSLCSWCIFSLIIDVEES